MLVQISALHRNGAWVNFDVEVDIEDTEDEAIFMLGQIFSESQGEGLYQHNNILIRLSDFSYFEIKKGTN